MTLRRIFVAGCRGQVATELASIYGARGEAVHCAGRPGVDIANPAAVLDAITAYRPDLVINAAAYTNVDKAEEEIEQAFRINRDGARHMAVAARAVQAPLIHLSTDYVFDGSKPDPYVETDRPNPLNVYGTSKLAGEVAIAAETHDHVILRTSWVYAPHGNNFVKTMLRLAMERDEIRVVDDQHGAPTSARDLATAICRIGDQLLAAKDRSQLSGLYHAAASGHTTWCVFARAIVDRLAAKAGRKTRIVAITTDQFPRPARRPANSLMDCSKLAKTFNIRLPDWTASLDACMEQLLKHTPETPR